ncbi:MAG TPA: glycosyltransferase [Nitrososphaerales archaeon]|nr:glycosyltransferase [Nitrososphaerales archaeon]
MRNRKASTSVKVAFLFDHKPSFPPDFNNMKCFYVSDEMTKRGIEVLWLNLDKRDNVSKVGGIVFLSLKVPTTRMVSALLAGLRIMTYCIVNSVRIVYIDAWFYFRDSPLRQLATIMTLRVLGVRVVVDQRDPYLDFEVARGAVTPGTFRYRLLKIHEKATLYACSLLILPSRAYEILLRSEGAPATKVKGFFRGIDLKRFNPSIDGSRIRARLGLGESFVIGWFGIMYRYRHVKEVLIPLAQTIGSIVPNGRMVLGGKGSLEGAVREAERADKLGQFAYVGSVKYSELPEYLSACDVLLCPVSKQSRFSSHSNWLKILEGLAVGVPVIATKTESSVTDLGELKGVVWTGESLADFQASIESTYKELESVKADARGQADELHEFGIERTIPAIVDLILQQ